MTQPPVWAVIPTYGHLAATRQALQSLFDLCPGAESILVVDNGSPDDTVACLQREAPEVEVIANGANLGFAAAANIGLRRALKAGAQWVLLVNNDILAERHMLGHLLAAVRPTVGAIGPLIYYLDEPARIWSAGFGRGRWLPEPRRGWRGQLDDGRFAAPFEVDYLLGCAMLISRSALLAVGGFDERYFFTYEDLDLCARLARAGYSCLTAPQARLWHAVATSARLEGAFRVFHLARGSVLFLSSQARTPERALAAVFRSLVAMKKGAVWLATGRPDLVRAHFAGLVAGYRAARQPPRIAHFASPKS